MKEGHKGLKIGAKVLARRSNTMWDILLATGEAAKALASSVLITKTLRVQTEYMGTQKTRITLHRVPMYIAEDNLGAFFFDYILVEGVSPIRSRADIATSYYEIMVTFSGPKFNKFPNVITCGGRNIYVVVEGRRPNCRACGALGHLTKLCPTRNPAPQPNYQLSRPRRVYQGRLPVVLASGLR